MQQLFLELLSCWFVDMLNFSILIVSHYQQFTQD